MTERMIRAIEHPLVDVLGHPSGRKIERRAPYAFDVEAVIEAAAESGTMLEINASPDRRDLNEINARAAAAAGVPIVINCDAHRVGGFEVARYGIATARRGVADRGRRREHAAVGGALGDALAQPARGVRRAAIGLVAALALAGCGGSSTTTSTTASTAPARTTTADTTSSSTTAAGPRRAPRRRLSPHEPGVQAERPDPTPVHLRRRRHPDPAALERGAEQREGARPGDARPRRSERRLRPLGRGRDQPARRRADRGRGSQQHGRRPDTRPRAPRRARPTTT